MRARSTPLLRRYARLARLDARVVRAGECRHSPAPPQREKYGVYLFFVHALSAFASVFSRGEPVGSG